MLNFEYIRKHFEQQAIDILRYEFYYYNEDIVREHFKQRMKDYISISWSLCKPKIKFFEDENIIGYKVEFPAESTGGIPFGFQYGVDIEMLKNLKLSI